MKSTLSDVLSQFDVRGDGPRKPSVTELLDLLNKPALLKWANKIGLEGVRLEEYRSKSTAKGDSLHRQIKDYVQTGKPFEDSSVGVAFDIFAAEKKIIEVEKSIETEWFVGRYDAEILWSGETYLCDFKSSSWVYLENVLQLTAYRMAFGNCKVAIVELPSFVFKPLAIQDFSEYENILKSLASIYFSKRKLNSLGMVT